MELKKQLQWLWSYYHIHKVKFVIWTSMAILCSYLLTVNPRIIGTVINELIAKKGLIQGEEKKLIAYLLGMVGITVLTTLGRYIYLLGYQKIAQDVVFEIRKDVYHKIQKLDFEYLKKTQIGTLMSRVIGDTESILNFLAFAMQEMFVNFLTFIFVMILVLQVSPLLFFALLMVLPLFYVMGRLHSKYIRPVFVKTREHYARLNSTVQENVSGNRVVRAFLNEEYELEKFDRENDAFMKINLDAVKIWGKYIPILDSSGLMLYGVMIGVCGYLYSRSVMNIGEVAQMFAYIGLVERPLRSFGWMVNRVEQVIASQGKIMELMAIRPKVSNPYELEESRDFSSKSDGEKNYPPIRGEIEFKKVSFGYEDELVVQDFDLHIKPGQTVALIGATGSGKSTVTELIARFYDITQGELLIDSKPVDSYDLQYLRNQIAMSMQDVFLFSDTISNNITYGHMQAKEEEIRFASSISGVSDFVDKMPEGFDTVIGESGVGLSGGQKQRIALARALIKNPPILILDDTTSSVDMETEYEIHKALKQMPGKRSMILIAHRISSIKDADEIIVMDQGRIIERGSHEELLEKQGYYYSVFCNQLGDFDLAKSMLGGVGA